MTNVDIVKELLTEFTKAFANDDTFDSSAMEDKIKGALNEVQETRRYPSYYTESQIVNDLNKFYSTIKNVALYDYNQIGAEFQESHNENSVSRSWKEREKLFSGVIPIATF